MLSEYYKATVALENSVLNLMRTKVSAPELTRTNNGGLQLNDKTSTKIISEAPKITAAAVVDKGKYVIVKIAACRGHTLRAVPLALTSLVKAHGLLTSL